MLKNVGYIGYGFVGRACERSFRYNSNAIIIDPAHSISTWEDLSLADPRLIFIAVPAPTLDDGSVDVSVLQAVLYKLASISYKGIVVIKSTIPPEVIDDLLTIFSRDPYNLRCIYSPEFLREAHWEQDILNPKQIILSGNKDDMEEIISIYRKHSHISSDTLYMCTDYKTASLIKYTLNCFLATKVVFMNQLKLLYEDIFPNMENWEYFISSLEEDGRMGNSHMQVPGAPAQFGYGGSCFPKDMAALVRFDDNERMTLIRDAILANTKLRMS